MPFDGAVQLPKSFRKFDVWREFLAFVNNPTTVPEPMPLRILREAKALIADKNHWTQGVYEIYDDDRFMRRCALGALRTASHRLNAKKDDFTTAHNSMLQIARDIAIKRSDDFGQHAVSVERVNDVSTHRQVMKMFDDTIARYQPSSLFRSPEQSKSASHHFGCGCWFAGDVIQDSIVLKTIGTTFIRPFTRPYVSLSDAILGSARSRGRLSIKIAVDGRHSVLEAILTAARLWCSDDAGRQMGDSGAGFRFLVRLSTGSYSAIIPGNLKIIFGSLIVDIGWCSRATEDGHGDGRAMHAAIVFRTRNALDSVAASFVVDFIRS